MEMNTRQLKTPHPRAESKSKTQIDKFYRKSSNLFQDIVGKGYKNLQAFLTREEFSSSYQEQPGGYDPSVRLMSC